MRRVVYLIPSLIKWRKSRVMPFGTLAGRSYVILSGQNFNKEFGIKLISILFHCNYSTKILC